MKDQLTESSPEELRSRYLLHAAYYFYKAATPDETLVSSLNRVAAAIGQETLIRRGLAVPSAEEIYTYAKDKWPVDRLHETPFLEAEIQQNAEKA